LPEAENSYLEEGDNLNPVEYLRAHDLEKMRSLKEIPNKK
jgi:hypothetical protein